MATSEVKLFIDNQEFGIWTDIIVERSLEEVSGTFSFTFASDSYTSLPAPTSKRAQATINGVPVVTGYVDRVSVDYSSGDHVITLEGRDKTADLVDSKLDHTIEFNPPIGLEEIASKVIEELGLDMVVSNQVSDLEDFKKGEIVSANIGQTGFEFLEQYARMRQVILTTDGSGNLVITKPEGFNGSAQLRNIVGGSSNNIKSGQVSFDNSERYAEYTFYSQSNPAGDPTSDETPGNFTNKVATAVDSDIRESRKYREISESSTSLETLQKRADWEMQIRKAKSTVYNCIVYGHSPSITGAPWQPNMLVNIQDDFASIHESLLTSRVSWSLNVYSGSETSIELTSPIAYKEDPTVSERSRAKKKSAEEGQGEGGLSGDGTVTGDTLDAYKAKAPKTAAGSSAVSGTSLSDYKSKGSGTIKAKSTTTAKSLDTYTSKGK